MRGRERLLKLGGKREREREWAQKREMVQLERERESARESDRKRDYKLTYS